MSIQIGTNFDLKSKQFLDSRQGVQAKSDLKNWTTPVPPGFEVCLGEVWYYYDPTFEGAANSETGYWIPRLVGKDELEGEGIVNGENRGVTAEAVKEIIEERLKDLQGQLDDQDATINPITITRLWFGEDTSQPSPQKIEVGTLIRFYRNIPADDPNPELEGVITYELKKANVSTPLISNGKFPIRTKECQYFDGIDLKDPFRVTVEYQGKTYSSTGQITWAWRTYSGIYTSDPSKIVGGESTDDYISLSRTDIYGLNSVWSNGANFEGTFNCAASALFGVEHKHPLILIPARKITSSFPSIYVGGLSFSDVIVKYVNFQIDSGIQNAQYVAIFIARSQTGNNIPISIKG